MPLPDNTLAELVRGAVVTETTVVVIITTMRGRVAIVSRSSETTAAIILSVITAEVQIIRHWGHTVVGHVSEVVVHHVRRFLRHRGEHGGTVHFEVRRSNWSIVVGGRSSHLERHTTSTE